MKDIEQQIKDCNLCGNLPKLTDVYMQTGKTKFIIIGESPAKDGWIKSKKAFYNTAGKLQGSGRVLEKLLNNIDLKIEDIYFTKIVLYHTKVVLWAMKTPINKGFLRVKKIKSVVRIFFTTLFYT